MKGKLFCLFCLIIVIIPITIIAKESKYENLVKRDEEVSQITSDQSHQLRFEAEKKNRCLSERTKKEHLHNQYSADNRDHTGLIQATIITTVSGSTLGKNSTSGKLIFTGICTNSGNTAAMFIKITANFYDASNNFLGSDWTYVNGGKNVKILSIGAFTNALYSGDSGYFKMYTDVDYSKAAKYSCSYEYDSSGFSLANASLAIDGNLSLSNFYGMAKVTGKIKNNSSNYLTYFTEVYFCVLNSSNQVEDVDFTFVEGTEYNYGSGSTDTALSPGKSGPISDTFAYCSYSSFKSYLHSFEFNEVNTGTSGNPTISLNRTSLYFSAYGNTVPNMQTFMIGNSGSGTLNWSVSPSASWIYVSPSIGNNTGTVSVSVNPSGLTPGIYTGVISVFGTGATNTPQSVNVTLHVYSTGSTAAPFGELSTPTGSSAVYNSVPVTGWALDDIGIANVKIYNGSTYIGDAIFVDGARPDVEAAFPTYPNKSKAGWGYMLLTHFLPNGGNGTYNLNAKATDVEGHEITLGSVTITCDNAHCTKPFGAIDTPGPGAIASGKAYVNSGWVLTPFPNTIPINGSTINIFVDGTNVGHPIYNQYRLDIATLFPGYSNSNGAVGAVYLDTTQFKNGIHTIVWNVSDNAGNSEGIGSRYFTINNAFDLPQAASAIIDDASSIAEIESFDDENSSYMHYKELEMIQFNLPKHCVPYEGYVITGEKLKPLPVGSTLDSQNGIFYWQPGVGFLGKYRFVFIGKDKTGKLIRKRLTIEIEPKF